MAELQELKSGFWDKEYLVKDVEVSKHQIIRFCLVTKGNKSWITFREFYNSEADPIWKPGKDGGKFKLEQGMASANAIITAVQAAATIGLAQAQ
jgi:hypothetical protein